MGMEETDMLSEILDYIVLKHPECANVMKHPLGGEDQPDPSISSALDIQIRQEKQALSSSKK
jgi:hypothetical protein